MVKNMVSCRFSPETNPMIIITYHLFCPEAETFFLGATPAFGASLSACHAGILARGSV